MSILLITLGLVFLFAYGYWLMTRLERFICPNRVAANPHARKEAHPGRSILASLACKLHHV